MDGAAAAWALLAFAAGAALASAWLRGPDLVRWLRGAAGSDRPPLERLTVAWRLAEVPSPIIVARDIEVDVPPGARIVCSGTVTPQAYAVGQVRRVPDVPAEYAVHVPEDAAVVGPRALAPSGSAAAPLGGRAPGGSEAAPVTLLFLAGVRPGTHALVSADAALRQRLAAQARALWDRAEPYVEACRLGDVPARLGLPVLTQGVVTDTLVLHGVYLLRLEADGQALGVRVNRDGAELAGRTVQVRGTVERDAAGYPILVAQDLRPLQ